MNLIHAEYTSRGLVRENNEDTCLSCTGADSALFLVADGIGGRSHGEVASGMLRDGFYSWWKQFDAQNPRPELRDVSEEIRNCLLKINQDILSRMGSAATGSTIVLLFLYQGKMLTLSSGDSRIYRARGLFSWNQITVDDVYENYRDRNSSYDPSKVGHLTGALGIRKEPIFTMRTEQVKTGDRFLLCSDGLTDMLSGAEICALIKETPTARACVTQLMDAALSRGGRDNITIISIRVHDI